VSLTTGSNPGVNAASGQIPDIAWTAIHYPQAFVDDQTASWSRMSRLPRSATPLHLTPEERAGHRPVDRAPGQAVETEVRARARRVVRRVAHSHGVHF
jgi:hypothetical protein